MVKITKIIDISQICVKCLLEKRQIMLSQTTEGIELQKRIRSNIPVERALQPNHEHRL